MPNKKKKKNCAVLISKTKLPISKINCARNYTRIYKRIRVKDEHADMKEKAGKNRTEMQTPNYGFLTRRLEGENLVLV